MDMQIILWIISICLVFFIGLTLWLKSKLKSTHESLMFLNEEKEYYSEVLMVLSSDYDIIYANQAAKSLFSLDDKYHQREDGEDVLLQQNIDAPLDFFEVIENEIELEDESFHLKSVLLVINGRRKQVDVYVDMSGLEYEGTITCIIDMHGTENVQTAVTDKKGSIDFLTGLPSQFSAMSDVNDLVMKSKNKQEYFTLFLLGIDNFSQAQINLGMHFTNRVLKEISKHITRDNDDVKIYRMDCDKFLFVTSHLGNDDEVYEFGKETMMEITRACKKDNPVQLTFSMGVVNYPEHGSNATKLIDHLYLALSQAQDKSISNIEIFTSEEQTNYSNEIKLNEEIRQGIENNEFVLYYQPMFYIRNQDMVGAEVLLRWNHPKHGLITADKFLDVAKKSGLMVDLGEYVFKEAIRQRREWDKLGFNKFQITINLSLREMQVDKFTDTLSLLFNQYHVNPKEFNLDIAEDAAMFNAHQTSVDLQLLKELGVSVSLDHFGVGYSSLKYLQSLPLSMLKIDRSLIFDMITNESHYETVKAIIALGHSLGLKVVAEGVETSKEFGLLRDEGCDYAQGYVFTRPLPVSEFEALFDEED